MGLHFNVEDESVVPVMTSSDRDFFVTTELILSWEQISVVSHLFTIEGYNDNKNVVVSDASFALWMLADCQPRSPEKRLP